MPHVLFWGVGQWCHVGDTTKDRVPGGFGDTGVAMPSMLHICGTTVDIQALHGSLLPVHPVHLPAAGYTFLQFLFV